MTNPSIGIMKFRVIRSVWVRSDPVSKHKVFIRINTQNVVRDDAGLVKWWVYVLSISMASLVLGG